MQSPNKEANCRIFGKNELTHVDKAEMISFFIFPLVFFFYLFLFLFFIIFLIFPFFILFLSFFVVIFFA